MNTPVELKSGPFKEGFKPLAWDAKYWPVPDQSTVFPEHSLEDWPPQGSTDTGICFSGGGARAMSAAMGQMRGLRELGVLGNARYMSCVSGGSWAGTIYTFVPTTTDDDVLLGDYLAPESIVSKSQVTKALDLGCMCQPVTLSLYEAMEQFLGIVPDDHLWLRGIGYRFLRPFGKELCEWGLNSITNSFTWNRKTLQSILNRNGKAFDGKNFYVVEDRGTGVNRRPFLIDMTTLIWKPSQVWPREYLLPVECTPYYSGIPGHYTKTYDGYNLDIGGGFVESFAFGRELYAYQPQSGDTVWAKMGRPFVLSDMTGTSSAFFAADAAKVDMGDRWDPAFNYYPIPPNRTAPYGEQIQLTGDGGDFDNTGILPHLIRRVGSIISFINSEQKLEWSELHSVPIVARMLPPLFGYKPYSVIFGYEMYPSDSSDPWALLKVFESDQFEPLIRHLADAFDNGQTAMWKDEFRIAADNKLGISYGGNSVSILWVYNNPVATWTDAIQDSEVRSDVQNGSAGIDGPLVEFPNFSTAFEDTYFWDPSTWKMVAGLTPYQSTMLSDLSHWNVTTTTPSANGPPNRKLIQSMFE